MHYERAGRGKPPIVFVHGFACDSTDWNAQMDRFQVDRPLWPAIRAVTV